MCLMRVDSVAVSGGEKSPQSPLFQRGGDSFELLFDKLGEGLTALNYLLAKGGIDGFELLSGNGGRG